MTYNKTALFLVFGLLLQASACVTVNVHFPESAVQKATDDYVRELYRAKEKSKTPTAEEASSLEMRSSIGSLDLKTTVIHAFQSISLIGVAHAEDEAFNVRTPKALEIQKGMSSRLSEVLKWKREGVLGETRDGYLVIRPSDKVKKLLEKKLEKLVQEENADRDALYQEILNANKLDPGKLPHVKRSFSRSFQSESPTGTWVEDADQKWARKP